MSDEIVKTSEINIQVGLKCQPIALAHAVGLQAMGKSIKKKRPLFYFLSGTQKQKTP